MPDATDDRLRGAFHFCLFAILLPILALPFVWYAAVGLRAKGDVGKTYLGLIRAIAVVDTLIALVILFAPRPAFTEDHSHYRLGLEFVGEEDLRVTGVGEGSPAEEAGLQVGDVVLEMNERDVASMVELKRERDAAAGKPISIAVRRGEETLEFSTAASLVRRRVGLFEVSDAVSMRFTELVRSLLPVWFLVLTAGLWWWTRNELGHAFWSWILFALLAPGVVMLGTGLGAAHVLGGWTLGGRLLSMLVHSVGFVSLAYVAYRRFSVSDAPSASVGSVVLRGVLLALLLIPRSSGLGFGLKETLAAFGQQTESTNPLEFFAHYETSPLTIAVFFVVVVVLAPIGEELLFRGVLLPRLAGRLGPVAAVVVTAVLFGSLHLHYGPFALHTVGLGLVLGWARLSSGGVAAPILLHALQNAVGMTLALGVE